MENPCFTIEVKDSDKPIKIYLDGKVEGIDNIGYMKNGIVPYVHSLLARIHELENPHAAEVSDCSTVKFIAQLSDYDQCVDVSAEGFRSISGSEQLPALSLGDGISNLMRFHLARLDKGHVPNLIAALQQVVEFDSGEKA